MGLDGSGETYVVLIRSPTPGWVPTLDRVADQYKHKAIFITLRKPNPAYFYAQEQVEQRIGTSVLSFDAVKIYARTLDFDQRAEDQPYTLAAQAEGTKRN
jgi:hypothetical protein